MIAIALLTLKPNVKLIKFYKKICRNNYDFYCFIDDNSINNVLINDNVNFIQIDDYFCAMNGFQGFNPVIRKNNAPLVSAWDKAIFYFCQQNRSYDHVWFIEDDVFVPSTKLFYAVDSQYKNADLLSSENVINITGELESWDWWRLASDSNLRLPWAKSMVCALRVSKKLLWLLAQHVNKNKYQDKFIEYIFHTLALHKKLSVKIVENLSGIEWRREWLKDDLNYNTFYHPVKSIQEQILFRENLNVK
jgi:hypothetical protein